MQRIFKKFLSLLFFPVFLFFNFLFSIVFWLIFFSLVILNSFIRLIVGATLKILYGSTYTLMEGCDATYNYKLGPNDPGSPFFNLLLMRGKHDIEELRRRYLKVFKKPAYKKLTCCIDTKLGYSVWKETKDFDIKKLVRYWEDPDDVIDMQRIYEIVGEYSISPMATDLPQWDIVVIPQGVQTKDDYGKGEDTYAILHRMNHCYSDAFSYLTLMNNELLDEPFEFKFNPTHKLPVSFWQWIYIYSTMALFGPFRSICTLFNFMTQNGKTKFSRTSFSQKSRALVNYSNVVDIKILKDIQKASKTSTTAIIYAAISAAMRKCHLKLYPNEKLPKMIENSSQMIALVPYPKDKLYNGFALSFFPIPLATKDDDCHTSGNDNLTDEYYKDLLNKCHKSGKDIIKYGNPIMGNYLIHLLSSFPKIIGESIWKMGGSDVSLSNVPGPIKEGKWCGAKIAQWFNTIPLINIGIGIVSYTYNNELRFCIAADQRVMLNYKNVEEFSKDIVENIAKYKKIYLKN